MWGSYPFGSMAEDPLQPSTWHRSHRPGFDRIEATNPSRAAWVLTRWAPEKLAGRRGCQHSKADGTAKGSPPRWSPAGLLPYWNLPAKGRQEVASEALGIVPPPTTGWPGFMPTFLKRQAHAEDNRG